MQFLIYILYSNLANKYYIGFTSDVIEERLRRHNTIHKGFTGKVHDWKIVYTEAFSGKKDAQLRETEIKPWKSRQRIEQLIEKQMPF